MNNSRRRVAVSLLTITACAGLALTGCSAADDSGGDPGSLHIGAFVLATANAYAQQNMTGVKEAAEAAGDVKVTFFDGKFSGPTQLAQIQDAVASGKYDGFVVFANDGVAVIPGVEDAAAADIPVVAAYAPIGEDINTAKPQVDGVIGTVWHPNEPDGRAIADLTIAACKTEHADADPCKVAYVSGGNAVLFEQAKLKAFEAQIGQADVPIKLVAQQEGNFLVEDGRKAAENIIQANPDVDVIATSADQMTYGAQQAVEDAGLTGISLIGVGASKEGVAAVDSGAWFGTTVFLPVDEGKISTEMLIKSIRGEKIAENEVDVVSLSPIGRVYTRDSQGDFTPQWTSVG